MSWIALKVPTEVIQQILALFSATLSTDNLSQFPWFLGHICSRWRYIFLSMTTEFWYHISISFKWKNPSQPYVAEPVGSVVQFFLERDPAAPLSFAFKMPRPFSTIHAQQTYDLHQVLELLIDQSMRWEDVSFRTALSNLKPLSRAKDRLPLLRQLHLSFHNLEKAPAMLVDVFQTAPSLNVIRMTELANWTFFWPNLKTLSLEYSNPDFFAALSQMTSLERLCIYIRSAQPTPYSGTVISLPNVTTLHCDHVLLPFLKAPALSDFTINNSYSPDILSSFLRRSSCNVLRLHLRKGNATVAIENIRCMSQITRLKLSDVFNVEEVLKQLIIPTDPAHEPLARHMSSLHIRYAFQIDLPMSTLSRLVLSRASASDNSGYKRLQQLGMYMVCMPKSNSMTIAIQNLATLCKKHNIHYTNDPHHIHVITDTDTYTCI